MDLLIVLYLCDIPRDVFGKIENLIKGVTCSALRVIIHLLGNELWEILSRA